MKIRQFFTSYSVARFQTTCINASNTQKEKMEKREINFFCFVECRRENYLKQGKNGKKLRSLKWNSVWSRTSFMPRYSHSISSIVSFPSVIFSTLFTSWKIAHKSFCWYNRSRKGTSLGDKLHFFKWKGKKTRSNIEI